jgi:hypothetical protein
MVPLDSFDDSEIEVDVVSMTDRNGYKSSDTKVTLKSVEFAIRWY